MLKPFVLMTVHRKYFEMIVNIKRYHKLKYGFCMRPSLVLVWADPIKEDEWIFEKLLKKGYIDYVFKRPFLVNDIYINTSYPESININLGLEAISDIEPNSYCLMQAHDVFVYKQAYIEVDRHMQKGKQAVVCDWVELDYYSTNFFAVSMNKDYWPPVIYNPSLEDCLERGWWVKIGENPPNTKVYTDTNHLFWHSHSYGAQLQWLRKHKI